MPVTTSVVVPPTGTVSTSPSAGSVTVTGTTPSISTVTTAVLVWPSAVWVAVAVYVPSPRPGKVTVHVPSGSTVATWSSWPGMLTTTSPPTSPVPETTRSVVSPSGTVMTSPVTGAVIVTCSMVPTSTSTETSAVLSWPATSCDAVTS